MAREVAVVQKLTESEALKAIDAQLQKGQRRAPKWSRTWRRPALEMRTSKRLRSALRFSFALSGKCQACAGTGWGDIIVPPILLASARKVRRVVAALCHLHRRDRHPHPYPRPQRRAHRRQ